MKHFMLAAAVMGGLFTACSGGVGSSDPYGQWSGSSTDGAAVGAGGAASAAAGGVTTGVGGTASSGVTSTSGGTVGTTGGPTGSTGGLPGNTTGGTSGGLATTTGGTSGGTTGTGAFCLVQQLMQDRCMSCHSDPPLRGVPMALASYDDLMAPTPSNPSMNAAQMSMERMQDMRAPMPPAPAAPPTSAEIAMLQDWMNQGMPSTCDPASGSGTTGGMTTGGMTTGGMTTGGTTGGIVDPYDTPVTCTSNRNWTGGNRESPLMHPGGTCIDCHSSDEGPTFQLAGTLFPTAHEPVDCNGVDGTTNGAQVVVVDANGQTITMDVNSAGNFFYESRQPIALPYQAKVVSNGKERIMVASQESGDCNTCHTESGTNDAPGRIMLP